MRKSFVTLLLLAGAAAFMANWALADVMGVAEPELGAKLVNAKMNAERLAARSKLRVAAAGDTLYVGHSSDPAALPPWYIYAGTAYYPDPGLGALGLSGYWGWDNFNPASNDSLMGWWPYRQAYALTGGLTLSDKSRSWWALDHGNVVNYVLNSHQQDRTFGVNGVWHSDPGNVVTDSIPNTNVQSPQWAPITGNASAWCGLRCSGDLTVIDQAAEGGYGNPFSSKAYERQERNDAGGSDNTWPGYASQWDQMLYRDIVVAPGDGLDISFNYQSAMSTGKTTTASTRTGWFDKDPLSLAAGNFISSTDAGDALAPVDSFMVYVGMPVDVNNVTLSNGTITTVYDQKRRWFSEVIRIDQPYTEILTVAGDHGVTGVAASLTSTDVAPFRDANGVVRVCFRVKTNRGFDDTGGAYSSGGLGAVQLDDVTLTSGATVISNGFESASEINNTLEPMGMALNSYKSTGKPPAIYWHTHPIFGGDIGGGNIYTALQYSDLCGPPDSPSRACNIYGVVISAGDHDNLERAGGDFGTAEQETMDGIESPTINLLTDGVNPNGMGITDAFNNPSDDYYIWYDMYAGIYNLFFQGNSWWFGGQSYPAQQPNGAIAWGSRRTPPFLIFNPDPQCFTDWEPLRAYGLISTSNASGVPDSLRIFMGKQQECFRFAVSAGCSPTGGTYFDNISLAFINTSGPVASSGAAAVGSMSASIWDWFQDAFPANETAGLPGQAAFDTTAAYVKTGLNTAQSTGTFDRFDIPGDSCWVNASGDGMRVDLVFRIKPGVGNFITVGDKTSGLRAVPTGVAPASGDLSSFWGSYLADNGTFGTPGGHGGSWNPNVWNSARCDTLETNIFDVDALTPGAHLSLLTPGAYQTTYYEDEIDPSIPGPRVGLAITKHKCFLVDTAGSTNSDNITCSSVPGWVTAMVPSDGYDGNATTTEFTKILPDGQFTPGTHVEYFFRKSELVAPTVFLAVPDTNFITPQNGEGPSTDGHRWQEFNVLPDRWKDPAFNDGGLGMACLLVVDNNDRRGNERVWVSVADSIGATAASKRGANVGWYPQAGYVASDGSRDYTNENIGADPTIAVAANLGQPGTTWDIYNVKASESLTTGAGSIGSRLANRSGMALAAGKYSVEGPTPEMLRTYYRFLFIMTGDLNSGDLGPLLNKSQDDVSILEDFMSNTSGSATPRAVWAMGDGFAESEKNSGGVVPSHTTLLTNYMATTLRDPSYQGVSGNTKDIADLTPTSVITSNGDIYGVENTCIWSNDLLLPNAAVPGATAASYYEDYGPNGPYVSGVYAPSSGTRPWISLLDGWDIEHLRSRYDDSSYGRVAYMFNAFTNAFASLCAVAGDPTITLGVPQNEKLQNFLNLRNNPVTAGSAIIHFGLAKSDRVKVTVYDVAGREVRTLADRTFEAGIHDLTWDGTDNSGRLVARGVYFTQVKFAAQNTKMAKQLVLLK